MKRKMLMAAKKGLNYYSPLIAIMGIVILGLILSNLFVKQYKLSSDFDIGREQFRILLTESYAEKALLFVDSSARLALEQAAYNAANKGFRVTASPCVGKGSFEYWAQDNISADDNCVPKTSGSECYPSEDAMKTDIELLFKNAFTGFLAGFNSQKAIIIPPDYEKFSVSHADGMTEVLGTAKEPVAIKQANLEYGIKPNFRESMQGDVISEGNAVVAVAKQLTGKSKDDAKAVVSVADGVGGLDWNEKFDYQTTSTSCNFETGSSCSCCKTEESCEEYKLDAGGNPVLDKDGNPECAKKSTTEVPVGGGIEYTVVPYDLFNIPMSVKANDPASKTARRQLLVYDETAKKPALKELSYNFALSWIEAHPEDTKTSCACNIGHKCP